MFLSRQYRMRDWLCLWQTRPRRQQTRRGSICGTNHLGDFEGELAQTQFLQCLIDDCGCSSWWVFYGLDWIVVGLGKTHLRVGGMGERRKEFVGLQLEDGACGEAFLFVGLQLEDGDMRERRKEYFQERRRKKKSKN